MGRPGTGSGRPWTDEELKLLDEWIEMSWPIPAGAGFKEHVRDLVELFPDRTEDAIEAMYYRGKRDRKKAELEKKDEEAVDPPISIDSIVNAEIDRRVRKRIGSTIGSWENRVLEAEAKVKVLEKENTELKELLRKLAAVRQSVEEFQTGFKGGLI